MDTCGLSEQTGVTGAADSGARGEALAIRRLALEPFPLRPARSAQMVAFAVNDPRLTIRGEAAAQQYQQYWASSKF